MTADEARSLERGDHVEFADPAFEWALPPTRGIVCWVVRGEVGISWEGVPAVAQDPATDFEHVRRVAHAPA